MKKLKQLILKLVFTKDQRKKLHIMIREIATQYMIRTDKNAIRMYESWAELEDLFYDTDGNWL